MIILHTMKNWSCVRQCMAIAQWHASLSFLDIDVLPLYMYMEGQWTLSAPFKGPPSHFCSHLLAVLLPQIGSDLQNQAGCQTTYGHSEMACITLFLRYWCVTIVYVYVYERSMNTIRTFVGHSITLLQPVVGGHDFLCASMWTWWHSKVCWRFTHVREWFKSSVWVHTIMPEWRTLE